MTITREASDDPGGLRQDPQEQQGAEVIAHRRLRSVALGEHVTLQFGDEQTIRYQIQEMLRIEKIFEERHPGRDRGLCAAGARRRNWKATMLIEYR